MTPPVEPDCGLVVVCTVPVFGMEAGALVEEPAASVAVVDTAFVVPEIAVLSPVGACVSAAETTVVCGC